MKYWKMSEVRFVEANYMQMTDKEIAEKLGRTKELFGIKTTRNKRFKYIK